MINAQVLNDSLITPPQDTPVLDILSENNDLKKENTFLKNQIEFLTEQNRALKRDRFGAKKEAYETPEQGILGKTFNEAEEEVLKEQKEAGLVNVEAHTKRARGHRKALPERLTRIVEVIELPELERKDAQGNALVEIGREVSEKLKFEPAKISVITIERVKYGYKDGECVKTTPHAPDLFPRSIATPELVASVIVSKYADGLPLYRQEDAFKRLDIEISRQTLARWLVGVGKHFIPVWNCLKDDALDSGYVQADETVLQVLKEKGRRAESKSWMWAIGVPRAIRQIVLFEYDPHRTQAVARRLLSEAQGYVQTDGLGSYKILEHQPGVTRIGCNMHGRRRFERAFKTGSHKTRPLSEKGLQYYRKLYKIEAKIKALTPDQKQKIRQQEAVPLWASFKEWVQSIQEKVPPKSDLGGAIHYFLSEYDLLTGYLKDSRLEMDNGFIERAIRKFAIGRNNWLFSDTEAGAESSAVLYSLVVTAKINGVNPYKALLQGIKWLATAKTIEDYQKITELFLEPSLTDCEST